jgi:RNA polymerase sigma-70 factor (ECF subfamily)
VDDQERSTILAQRATGGDQQALEALLARHLPGLRAFVRLRMGPLLSEKEDASDLAQSACREALMALASFDHPSEGAFRKWLYTTALHKILQRARYWRADKRHPGHEAAQDVVDGTASPGALEVYATFCTPSQVAMGREELLRVERAFARLPDDGKEVIIMARIFGLSHKEIAAHLDRSEGAVRVLLHRTLARLAMLLDADT